MLCANLIFKESVTRKEFDTAHLLKNIEEAVRCNIKKLIITPAYYGEESETDIKTVKRIVDDLNSYLEVKKEDLTLYAGNLLRDNYNNIKYFINGQLGSINDSNYILLDVEECNKIDDLLEIIFEYKLRNLTPIIVSPERINEIIENPKNIDKLLEEECLFQLNPASLKGVYGKKVKKAAKALMKKNIYQFIGFEEEIQKELIDKEVEEISKESLFVLNPEGIRARRRAKNSKKKKSGIF